MCKLMEIPQKVHRMKQVANTLCMLSEQPGKELSSNPKSEIDPDEPMVYQIRVKLGNY
jgi:hypothetical protein